MSRQGQPFTSGNWVVKEGKEQEFIDRWTEFAEWTRDNSDGAESFWLIQQRDNATHFVSFGAWADEGSVQNWRSSSEFATRLGRCRELCDEFVAKDFQLVSSSEL